MGHSSTDEHDGEARDGEPRDGESRDGSEDWCEHPAPVSMALLVGEDRAELAAWRSALEDLGYDAVSVPDAESALASLQSLGAVELLIADARLASTGGLDLITAARLFDATLPVIAVTGPGRRGARAQARVVRGADAVLTRPCTRWQFMDAVDAACAGSGAAGRPAHAPGDDEPSGAA